MKILPLAAALLLATPALAQTAPTAAESDPARLGLMTGFPVPAEKQVRWDDGSMWQFPRTRWSFSHIRELMPTQPVRRAGPVSPLPRAERPDLDTVGFRTLDGRTMTWRESLDANFTDGIVVLHRGRIVYERYFGALAPDRPHLAMSVTKSFAGTLAEMLIAEGKLDPARTVANYVPELAQSGFGSATIRQLLDMRVGLDYSEDYAGLGNEITDITRLVLAIGWKPLPAGYAGPDGMYAYLQTLRGKGPHGGDFVYRTPNAIALAWVLERVTGMPLAAQIEQRFWARLGMEQDANLAVDRAGTGYAGGGLSASLRDMARFGEMMRLGGRWRGQQIVPPAAVAAIFAGGDPAAFAHTNYPGLEGGNYGSQWWHRAGGQLLALGINGQGIYIDRKAQLVIVRFASNPAASNRANTPVTIPAYDAIARALSGRKWLQRPTHSHALGRK